jgi:hypothetical protein
MGVDNWFFGNAVSMPTKAERHNDPSPLLCPEAQDLILRLAEKFLHQFDAPQYTINALL